MRFLLILIIAGGGYYFYNNHKEKSDAYKEYTSKSGNASKTSSDSDFKNFTNTGNNYKGLSKGDTITKAINNIKALHHQFNTSMDGAGNKGGKEVKFMIDNFIKKYITTLGKAYTASSSGNKASLKTIKTYVVNWYQRMGYMEQEVQKFLDMIEYGSKGNLSTMQSSNRHALTELAKLLKSDNHYVTTFKNNYFASMKKQSISHSAIKSYAAQLNKDFAKVTTSRIAVNKSLNVLIDKVYAFNSFVLRNSKNGFISVSNRGKYDALRRIITEIEAAERDFNATQNAYYNSYQ